MRLRLLAMGWLGVLLGTAFIVRLEVSIVVKIPLVVAWWLDGARSLARFVSVQRRLKALRFRASGGCEVIGPAHVVAPARVLASSIVTQHWAWLRVADEEGRIFSELLVEGGVETSVWRRFQVLSQWGLCH